MQAFIRRRSPLTPAAPAAPGEACPPGATGGTLQEQDGFFPSLPPQPLLLLPQPPGACHTGPPGAGPPWATYGQPTVSPFAAAPGNGHTAAAH